MKILDKYLIKEFIVPFFFGIMAFTILFMSADLLFRVVKLIVESKMDLKSALSFFANTLPSILVFTFPMAVLLAVFISFGRLSGDSEIIAMRAGGISLVRIATPVLLMCFTISLIAFYINEKISPEAKFRANNLILRKIAAEEISSRNNLVIRTFTPDGLERIIISRSFNAGDGKMEGITMQDYSEDQLIRWVFADFAKWDGDKWFLYNGDIINFSGEKTRDIKYKTHFIKAEFSELKDGPQDIEKREREPEEMSAADVKDKIVFLSDIVKKDPEAAQNKELLRKINVLKVWYYQKIALPFTCFVFGVFGIPLSLRSHRTSTSIGLGLSLVFILLYYVIMSIGRAFGENGTMDPLLASWLPNLIFGFAGGYLLYKASLQ